MCFLLVVLRLMIVPDVRQAVPAASCNAQRLPKAVRWNEGSDAEPLIDRGYQLCGIVFCYPPIERRR